MSRDPSWPPDWPPDPEHEPGEPPPAGHVRPTGPGSVVVFGLLGLVGGWALRPISIRLNGTAPTVGWVPVVALVFVAAVIAAVAWSTYRTIHRRHERLEPHRAVNRLVLAKSCALAGALVGGAYLGYALSWLGRTEAELARERVLHALVGGGAGVALVVGSLLLERACRVSDTKR